MWERPMIVRVVIAAQSSKVRERIARLLASKDVLLTPAPSLRKLLASPETLTCDVVVVAANSVDPDPDEVLAGASLLLDRPDVMCLTEGLDRSGEAHLLESGAILRVRSQVLVRGTNQ